MNRESVSMILESSRGIDWPAVNTRHENFPLRVYRPMLLWKIEKWLESFKIKV